jgi:small conductance mechanosensitive channel
MMDSNGVEQGIKILKETVEQNDLILKDPAPFVRITERRENAIVYTIRVWTKSKDFWPVRFDLLENINNKFEQENIKIPHNKMDVHIKNEGHPR